MKEGR